MWNEICLGFGGAVARWREICFEFRWFDNEYYISEVFSYLRTPAPPHHRNLILFSLHTPHSTFHNNFRCESCYIST